MNDATPETPETPEGATGTADGGPDGDWRERAEELRVLLKQQQAEFENYQKRAARDRETERRYAQFPLAQAILPAIDNLERALAAARDAGAVRAELARRAAVGDDNRAAPGVADLSFAAAFHRLAGDEAGVDRFAQMLRAEADRDPDRLEHGDLHRPELRIDAAGRCLLVSGPHEILV